jgi:ubiquinone/menaquinone biosynthesis C-methylase UbiE
VTLKEEHKMAQRDNAIRALYGKYAPPLNDWELLLTGLGEDSRYRRKAVASLGLSSHSIVLDVACGTGLNFKAVESYLGNGGTFVGVDISPSMLKAAESRVTKRGWENVELVNCRL